MNWLLVINDSKCKAELKSFIKKNKSSILMQANAEKLIKAISQSSSGNTQAGSDLIAINSSSDVIVVKVNDIVHCQSFQNYTQLHLTKGKKITSSKTLKQFETLFKTKQFARIHQSHLVNIRHIEKFMKAAGYIKLNDGTELPVATRKKEYLLNVLDKL